MKLRSCYEAQQIHRAANRLCPKQAELGSGAEAVCRKLGMRDASFSNRKKEYGGLGPSELRRLRQLEENNAQWKKRVADLSLDKILRQEAPEKKALKPFRLRLLINELRDRH